MARGFFGEAAEPPRMGPVRSIHMSRARSLSRDAKGVLDKMGTH